MDFNDLSSKLKRLYASMGEQFNEDITPNIVDEHVVFPDGRFEHTTRFGSNSDEANQNLIMNAIHGVGSLKDTIKQKLRDTGQDPNEYEQLIDATLALALVTDLDNKDKHGDPLTRSNRSGKDPQINDIDQGLRGRGITRAQFTTNFTTGKTTLNKVEGDVKVIVTANILSSDGTAIMHLEDMMEKSLQAVKGFIKDKGLIVK